MYVFCHSGLILPFLIITTCSGSTKCRKDKKFNRSSEEPVSEAKIEKIDLSYNFLKINDRDEFQNKYPGMFENNRHI